MAADETGRFTWEQLGDLNAGRPNLGMEMPVAVYRVMQYTLRDVLAQQYGPEQADDLFRRAGQLAGAEFCRTQLDTSVPLDEFVAQLQALLRELKVGILRVEALDADTLDMVLTVAEDLDCSGLPITGENVCVYDEGFIAGILEKYTGKQFGVREVDCWASGDRVCRFEVRPSDVV